MLMNVPNDQKVMIKNHERIIRTVIAFWFLGWFIKAYFLVPYIFGEVTHYPVLNSFFPDFFRHPLPLQLFYLFPVAGFVLIFRRAPFYYGLTAISMAVSSAILLLHQDTHNDATFLTSFWVAVWLMWFVSQMHKAEDAVLVHARSLALCVIAFIFWGGFVGKLTPEYWDGTVFSNIYMSQEPTLLNKWVRANLSEAAIRSGFVWISRAVILAEGFLALAPLWPFRLVRVLGVVFMLGISLFTTWRIFSVLFCLIGLLVALRAVDPAKKSL